MRTIVVENGYELGMLLFGFRPPLSRMLHEHLLDEAKSPYLRGTVLTPRQEIEARAADEDGKILPSFEGEEYVPTRIVRLMPGEKFRVVDFGKWKASLDPAKEQAGAKRTLGWPGKPSDVTSVGPTTKFSPQESLREADDSEMEAEPYGAGPHPRRPTDVMLYLQPEDDALLADVPPGANGSPAVLVVANAADFDVVSQPDMTSIPRMKREGDVEYLARKYGVDPDKAGEVGGWFYRAEEQGLLPDEIETLEDAIAAFAANTAEQPEAEKAKAPAREKGAASRGAPVKPAAPLNAEKLALLPDLDEDDRDALAELFRTAGFTDIDAPKASILPSSKFLVAIGPGPMRGYGELPAPKGDEGDTGEPPDDSFEGTLDSYIDGLDGAKDKSKGPFTKVKGTGDPAWKYLAAEAAARGFQMPQGKNVRADLGLSGAAPTAVHVKLQDHPYLTVMAYAMPDRVIAIAWGTKKATRLDKIEPVQVPEGPPTQDMSERELEAYLHKQFRDQFQANPETAEYPNVAFGYLYPRIKKKVEGALAKGAKGATPEEVEDAVQGAYLKSVGKFDATQNVRYSTFLVNNAKRLLIDIHRRKQPGIEYNRAVLRGEVPGVKPAEVDMTRAESFRAMVQTLFEADYPFRAYRPDQTPRLTKGTPKGVASAATTLPREQPDFLDQPEMPDPHAAYLAGQDDEDLEAPQRPAGRGPFKDLLTLGPVRRWASHELGGPLKKMRRGFAAGRREQLAQQRQLRHKGFATGFGEVVPPVVGDVDEAKEQLQEINAKRKAAEKFYFGLRGSLVALVTKLVPFTKGGFDITKPISLKPITSAGTPTTTVPGAPSGALTTDEQEEFSEGFEKVFLTFLRQSKEFVKIIGALTDVADDLHELLVGGFGVGLNDIREARSGIAASESQWLTAYKIAEELVQRPEPFADFDEYVGYVERALQALQQAFGGIDYGLEALARVVVRGNRVLTTQGDTRYVKKFTDEEGEPLDPKRYVNRALPDDEEG